MTETQVAKTYLETMTRSKAVIFTVSDAENCYSDKPVIWAQLTSSKTFFDQKVAEQLVRDFIDNNEIEAEDLDMSIESIAHGMRIYNYVWVNEQFCFELTEVNG